MGSWSTTDPPDPGDRPDGLAGLASELREAQELVDQLFRSNPEPMWIVDLETFRFLEVNDAAVARYGYTREQFGEMTLLDVRPESELHVFHDNHRRIGESPWARIDPVVHRRVDGSTFLVEPTVHDLAYRGRPARLARLRHLTDAEIAERRLAGVSGLLVERLAAIVEVWRELSERSRTVDELFDLVPGVAHGILGAGGAILYVRDGDELVPRSFAGHVVDAPRLPLERSLTGWVYLNGVATRSADYNHDPRAHVLRAHLEDSRALAAAPIPGVDEPVGVLVVLDRRSDFFDEADERTLDLLGRALGTLVRRFELEDAHSAVAERLQLVVEATTDAIYDWQVTSKTVWWSPGVQALFGHSVDHLSESPDRWAELIHPDEREELLADMEAALDDPSRSSWTNAYRFRRGDGTYLHIRDRAHILRRPDGRVERLIGGMTDISELVESETRILQSQRLEAVGQLTGGLAHDFNNLLTVVLGNADQLIVDLPEGHDVLVELAEMIRSAALRGAELSRQLLAFARRQPLEPRPIDVGAFLHDIARFVRRTIPENIHLDVAAGHRVPEAFVDPGQLERAIVNLCLNARDAMPDGGRISISAAVTATAGRGAVGGVAEAGPWVVITVGDSGTGIDPELLDRVTEPFFTTKPTGEGSGLGLSMVHGFVAQSGGHLEVSSQPGDGTTVRLYLPPSAVPVDRGAVATLRPDIGVAGAGERILVVEDDDLVRQLTVRQLRSFGYEVLEAGSGPDALEVLRSAEPIDLLFTDVIMPGGMDGRALAVAAVELRPDLEVLYTSGYSRDVMVRDGRLESGVELLVKPYRAAELARRVRQSLDAAAARGPRPGRPVG